MRHKPVLVQQVLEFLNLKPGARVVDGTLGSAGHALEILKKIGETGHLIALDQDPESIARCKKILEEYPQVSLHHENFANLDQVLDRLHISTVDAVILDVGFSSDQLEDESRGFSFLRPGPLDMRMNPESQTKARDLVNGLPERDLERLFRGYGEERRSRQYARQICEQRRTKPFETTQDLVEAIEGKPAFKSKSRKDSRPPWARIHPATRVFQALRIAVNRELENLSEGLPRIWKRVAPQGRLAVISFHSLEDRIVKRQFLAWKQAGVAKLVTKKPVTAEFEERKENPRARSAKLRGAEKLS